MPIDARIPLGVTPVDPNGFINALAAGMKMREAQNAADRLARKDEAAVRKSNALSKFYQSPRGSEDIATLAREAPDAVSGIEKNTREAQLAEIQTKKHQIEWSKANYGLLAEASGAILANPTRENANTVLDGLEAQGGDMTRARKQLETSPDEAIPTLAKGWAGNAKQVQEMAIAEEKAKPKPQWDSYRREWITPPGSTAASTTAPAEPAATQRRPNMVDPGGSGFSTDRIKAEIDRLDRGEPLSPEFAGISSREGLVTLLQAQTDLERAQAGGAAAPPDASVPSVPPVDGPPTPAQPTPGDPQPEPAVSTPPPSPPATQFRSPMERDNARFQAEQAKAAETQRIQNEQLQMEKRRYADEQRAREEKREVQSGERLTPADASKARQKLIRLEDFKRQLALVKDTWYGTKDDKGKQVTKGIRNTMAAGPGAGIYAPDLFSEGGEKFNTAVESMAASKTALLRVPGLGSQSDLEQGLERLDLPSRSTHEGTTEQQIKAYEDLIANWEAGLRAALAGPAKAPAEPGSAAPVQVTPQSDQPTPTPVKVAPLEELDDMPMPGKYKGKYLTDKTTGIRYRSDGSNWIKQ